MTNSADPEPTDWDLDCLLRQGMSCSARGGLTSNMMGKEEAQTCSPEH